MMNLTLREPFRHMHGFNGFDRLVGDPFGRRFGAELSEGERSWRPATDLVADEAGYTLRVDLPGMAREAIDIDLSDDVLTVRGKREDVVEEKGDGEVYMRETYRGSFERRFRLPTDAERKAIKADYADGVLKVRVPKSEAAVPKKIPIGNSLTPTDADTAARA
jgi:HSP20 family protein